MLLELNFCSCLLELALDLLGLLLGNTLLDGLRSTVDESLGVTQRKAGDVLDGLDYLELGLTGVLQNLVERRLLGGGGRARGWKKADKSPALNPDLWGALLEESAKHTIHYHWLKGHAGHPENERCDQMAVEESRKFR